MQNFVRFTYKILFLSFCVQILLFADCLCYADSAPESFINDIYGQIKAINRSKIASGMQQKKIKDIMMQSIDFDSVAKFILGRELNKMSTKQFEEFKNVYKHSVGEKYSEFLSGYDQEFTIVGSNDLGKNRYLVHTKVQLENAREKIKISYLMINTDDSYKIIDIVFADGISIAFMEREEIRIFLAEHTIEDLIKKLS